EKFVNPVQRVSAYACCAINGPPAYCGGRANRSSSVVPPTSIDPLSRSADGTPEYATSFKSVTCEGWSARFVGVDPPFAPIATVVYVRTPSPAEIVITTFK